MRIRPATPDDGAAIARIYNHYVAHTTVTFEEDPVAAQDMSARIAETLALNLPYFVACNDDGAVTGYAYASRWKGRCAYRYSVEVTVYLDPENVGQGTGTALYNRLFAALKERGYHLAIGGITLPNPASIALHEKFGMTKAGEFEEVGYKFGRWINVGYWQGRLG